MTRHFPYPHNGDVRTPFKNDNTGQLNYGETGEKGEREMPWLEILIQIREGLNINTTFSPSNFLFASHIHSFIFPSPFCLGNSVYPNSSLAAAAYTVIVISLSASSSLPPPPSNPPSSSFRLLLAQDLPNLFETVSKKIFFIVFRRI